MDCPSFFVAGYGVFDSRIAYPKLTVSRQRSVSQFELEWITDSNNGIAYINDQAYPLKPGLLLCAKPGQLRYSQLPFKCYYVHLQTSDSDLLSVLCKLPDTCYPPDYAAITDIFRQLATLPQPQNTAQILLLQSRVTSLLSLLCTQTAPEMHAEPIRYRIMFNETEQYIRHHLSEPLSLSHLAERTSFSPSRFHVLFTSHFGQTPHEYVTFCRIEAAKAALRIDQYSLVDIAANCGFSSQSHFCAQFKKATGQTPLQYRNAHLSRIKL